MRLDVDFKENNRTFNNSFGELEVINGKSAYEIAVEEGSERKKNGSTHCMVKMEKTELTEKTVLMVIHQSRVRTISMVKTDIQLMKSQ